MSRYIAVILACAVSFATPSALAESASLPGVRELVEGQEYDEAQEALARILATGDLGPPQLVEVYRFMAECSAALRQPDDATDAFVRLLAIDPDFYVSSSESPLLREPFEQAQAYWSEHTRPAPSYESPRAIPPDEPYVVAVERETAELPTLFADTRVHFRTRDEAFYTTLEAEDGRATISREQLENASFVEIYISVHDEHGNVAAWIGTPEEPLRVGVGDDAGGGPTGGGGTDGPDRRPRLHERWWFWTIIGAVVVGLAVGIPLGLTQSTEEDPCVSTLGSACDIVVPLLR